jgi:hypothetical protein
MLLSKINQEKVFILERRRFFGGFRWFVVAFRGGRKKEL